MIGPQGSGPGWYYKGKHYDAPQALHEAMNAEIESLELQVTEWRGRCESNLHVSDAVRERLRLTDLQNEELREALRDASSEVGHSMIAHSIEKIGDDYKRAFDPTCPRCKVDRLLEGVTEKQVEPSGKCEVCHGAGRPECGGPSGCYCGCHGRNWADTSRRPGEEHGS